MILRDYLYLDTQRLQDYLSSLDQGVIEELEETVLSAATRGLKAGVGAGALSGGGQRESTEQSQLRASMKVSSQNLFSRLYDELHTSDLVQIFDENDPLDLQRVRRGAVVEISRRFSLSPINLMINSVLEMVRLMETWGSSEPALDQQARQVIRTLAMIFRGDEGTEEVPLVAYPDDSGVSVVFVAKTEFMLCDEDEFSGDMTTFGRVQRIYPEGTSLDLFDLVPGFPRGIMRSSGSGDLREGMLKLFDAWPDELGGPIDRGKIHVAGPAILVAPVAVYV